MIQLFRYSWSFNFETWTWKFSTIRSEALLRSNSNVSRRSALQPFTVPDSLLERFREFATFLRPETLRYGHETFRNGQKRWTVEKWSCCLWSTVRNVSKITFKFQNWKVNRLTCKTTSLIMDTKLETSIFKGTVIPRPVFQG